MASGEAELQPRVILDYVALAIGLALRDILLVGEYEEDSELPQHLKQSPCSIIHTDPLLTCCADMASKIQSVYGGDALRPKRKQNEE